MPCSGNCFLLPSCSFCPLTCLSPFLPASSYFYFYCSQRWFIIFITKDPEQTEEGKEEAMKRDRWKGVRYKRRKEMETQMAALVPWDPRRVKTRMWESGHWKVDFSVRRVGVCG